MRTILFISLVIIINSCQPVLDRDVDSQYRPVLKSSNFTSSTELETEYFNYAEDKTYVYEGLTAEGLERVELIKSKNSKHVLGIKCAILLVTEFIDGQLTERTFDWHARDNQGQIWYFGESVQNYNMDGSYRDHEGSWEAGQNGAQPGIVMLSHPIEGSQYRQEYYFDHAEDEARVEDTNLIVITKLDTFYHCLKTYEWTELDPSSKEYKYYAPNVGLIKIENIHTNSIIELIEIK